MTRPAAVTAVPPLVWWRRPPVLVAVTGAWWLARQSPARIQTVLTKLRRGARPATYPQALKARNDVLATSVQCHGEGCLQRSLATALLCRLRGTWPTWCTGVRTHPFGAHAWVQVGDRPVDEPYPDDYYRPMLVVAPGPGTRSTVKPRPSQR
ncbi:lasso peptide biosynthesis B2 protein [Saccharopolyspora indica]|uniref:lasso peptide biosynthesis B2 protein n=1 Tax=Saccharopolyspora indica TaxID=1229659 RepID=UPI0022EB58E3|nr:lasso peptide biosynthesis B2 protein [Saccharopolyspora indica]MDA3647972.1 lasso peptide biosynthesis B2 protein [Saccharopolyspora indica]